MKFIYEYRYFDPKDFIEIYARTDWYIQMHDLLREYFFEYHDRQEKIYGDWQQKRKEIVMMTSEFLREGAIGLSKRRNTDFDKGRKPIDTIVIHHSGHPSTQPFDFANAMNLINVYARKFSDRSKPYYGMPIASGHFYEEKPIFIAYHYFILDDGSYTNYLKDEYVGLHCGDTDYNNRSIALCFHDELDERQPSVRAIEAANDIISRYPGCQILGHGEIQQNRSCPGTSFYGENGWKHALRLPHSPISV